MLSRHQGSVLEIFLYPTPSQPLPPEQKMIMQPIKWGIYLNCVSAKAIEFLALFNCLETRKFWYIIQGLRLIVKAKHSRISGINLTSFVFWDKLWFPSVYQQYISLRISFYLCGWFCSLSLLIVMRSCEVNYWSTWSTCSTDQCGQ